MLHEEKTPPISNKLFRLNIQAVKVCENVYVLISPSVRPRYANLKHRVSPPNTLSLEVVRSHGPNLSAGPYGLGPYLEKETSRTCGANLASAMGQNQGGPNTSWFGERKPVLKTYGPRWAELYFFTAICPRKLLLFKKQCHSLVKLALSGELRESSFENKIHTIF